MTGSREKRERLTDAAANLFWTKGYYGTSLADIAKASGVPLGNIYYYFRTKADFALAVADLFVSATTDALAALEETEEPGADRVDAFFSLLAGSAAERMRLGCPIARHIRDVADDAPEASGRAAEALLAMERWLSDALGEAEVGKVVADAFARQAVIIWQGSIVLAQASGDETLIPGQLDRLKKGAARLISDARTSGASHQTWKRP